MAPFLETDMNINPTLHNPLISRLAMIFGAAIAIASLAACSDDSESSPSPTPSAPPTSSATPAPTSPTSTASQVTPIPTYGPETRIGIAAIDPVLVSLLAADTNDVGSRLAYVDVPCTTSGAIPGPECPPGATAGTLVPAFPLTGCESTYERKDTIGPVVEGFVTTGLKLFAIYRVDRNEAGNVAPGDLGFVFVDPRPTPGDAGAIMVTVTADTAGKIVRWASSCGATDPREFMDERPVSDYVLPPR
jgi:hypothetical protein